MSNSPLVSYINRSPHCNKPRNHIIDSVAIHCMSGNGSLQGVGVTFQDREASSNYAVDEFGKVGMYVDECDRSWCTSSAGVDNRAVTIEVADLGPPDHKVTEAAYEGLINLLVDICRRNHISSLKWKADKTYAYNAANGGSVSEQNMFVHRWFSDTGKTCPGDYLYALHGEIAKEVNRRILGNTPIKGIPAVTITADGSPVTTTQNTTTALSIDYKKLHPYIVTIDRDTSVLTNWAKLKGAGVVGAMVEGGYLYSKLRKRQSSFRSPKLSSQMVILEKNELPWALYMTCRPKCVKDAEAEIEEFSYILRRYPPALGVWLRLDMMTSNKDLNDKIVYTYRDELTRLGFKQKMGLYVDYAELDKIHWNKHMNDWALWSIDHVKTLNEIDKLLDPKFFDTEGKYIA